jgi:hypothetical protein
LGSGVGGGGEQVVDGVDLAGLGAHVDGGGVPVEAEVVLGGGKPTRTEESMSGASTAGFKMPAT